MDLVEYTKDDDMNKFWKLPNGVAQNLLDEAIIRIAELEQQLVAAQEQLRWHFEDPPVRSKYYWCAFDMGQGPCYFSASGIWFGRNIIAWRELPEQPKSDRRS